MEAPNTKTIQWQLVETGFTLYVVFHLLPSFLVASSFSILGNTFSLALWTFLALAPVSYLIGYRSEGVTILEPGLSALLYAIVLVFGLQKLQDTAFSLQTLANSFLWIGAAFVVSVGSAWVGEMMQARSLEKKRTKNG